MTMVAALALAGATLVALLILWRPPIGVLALVCFYPFNAWVPRLPVPGLNAETILFGLAIAVTLMRFGFRVPPFRYSAPLLAYVGVLLMAFAIGSFESRSFYGARLGPWELFKLVKALAFPTLFFVIAYFWFQERRDRRRLLNAATVAVFLAATSGAVEFILSQGGVGTGGRIESLFRNPNGLGLFLAPFALIPLYLLRSPDSSRVAKLFYLFAYAIAQFALIVTLSRAAWLATATGHAVWFAFVNRQMFAVGAAAMILMFTVAFPLLPDIIQNRLGSTLDSRTVVFQVGGRGFSGGGADRIVYYSIAADMFMESPIWGHGLESFFLLSPKYGAKYGLLHNKAPHSVYVKVSSEMGLIGLGVFGWIALTVLLAALRVWRYSTDRYVGVLLLAGGASIVVGDIFHNSFLSTHQLSAFFWLVLAVAVRELEDESSAEETAMPDPAPSPARGRRPAWAAQRAYGQ